jgi:hypothetical protein
MPSFTRLAVAAALAVAFHAALAQTAVPPTLTVQRLAPQLIAFAGSQNNFQSLVTGLAQGTPIQLVTVLPDGFTQVVTFTPAAALPPVEIAQLLETARQQLIGLGIGNPTAEQIGITLMGGIVPTALGGSQVAGLLNAQNPPSPAAQIQRGAAAGATTPASPATAVPAVTSAVSVQLFPNTLPVTPTSTVTAPRNTSDSPAAAGATSRSIVPLTSASPPATTPTPAPGAGSTPAAAAAPLGGGTPSIKAAR